MSKIKIPGFRIERFIAEGGMASVFLAVQVSLHRSVALKILKKFDSPEHAERFLREGRTIASLNHRNIITIHDIGVIGDRHYISMEYLDGGSLRERIDTRMPGSDILDLMESICSCLDFVHRKGIIHRDIKPSNILFHTDGTAKLTDFGIAKQLNSDQDLTIDGSAFGSPYYISPEQAEGHKLDGRADIYALGIIFYEMLTGKKPFAEKSHLETILAHLTHPIPKLPKAYSKYQVLLEHMIAKAPGDRAASAKELLDLIQKLRSFDTPSRSKSTETPQKRLSTDWARSFTIEWAKRLRPSSITQRTIIEWVKRLQPSSITQGTIIEWVKRLRPSSMTRGTINEWVKRLRQSPMSHKGIIIMAFLLVAIGTGIPLYGHLSQKDHEARVELVSANEKNPIEISTVPTPESTADDPVEEIPGKQPLTVQSEKSIPSAIPVILEEKEPDNQNSMSESLMQPPDNTALKQPEVEKAPIQPVDEKALVVSQLLEAGDRALKAYRLTTPSKDNAFSHYQKVIEVDPDNTDAKAGIKKIADTYARLSYNEINKQNYRLARVYLWRGAKVEPGNARWPKLESELKKLEKSRVAELKQQSQPVQDKGKKSKFSERFKKFWQSLKK